MTVQVRGLRRFISSSRPLCKSRNAKLTSSKSPRPKPKDNATPPAVPLNPTTSEQQQVKLRMQRIPRWDDGWGTQGPRKDPAVLAAQKKAKEEAEKERQRRAQRNAEEKRLLSLGLSYKDTYGHCLREGELARRLESRIPYMNLTALQVAALEQLRGGNNVFIQSTNLGMTTAYLIPVISQHVEWKYDGDGPASDPQTSWMSVEAIPTPRSAKKGRKKSAADLLDSGPNSIRVIIICPNAQRVKDVERKCRQFAPVPVDTKKVSASKKTDGEVHVVCLTHTEPSQTEREAVQSRKSHILITTSFPLLDHLINTKGFQKGLSRLRCVVFDRADEFPHPDWLPALRESLVTGTSSDVQWVAAAKRKTKTSDAIADLFLSDAGYSSVSI